MALALLLPLALAACGEADQEEAPPEEPGEETVEEAGEGFNEELGDLLQDDMVVVEMDADGAPVVEETPPVVPGEEAAAEPPGEITAEEILAEMAVPPPTPSLPWAPTVTRVRALDKITARVTELDLPQDIEVRFGTLAIRARTCRTRAPEEPPETFAFLEIDDVTTDRKYRRVFAGWMMASSPALNALEHPVYDIWVIACKRSSGEASSASE